MNANNQCLFLYFLYKNSHVLDGLKEIYFECYATNRVQIALVREIQSVQKFYSDICCRSDVIDLRFTRDNP